VTRESKQRGTGKHMSHDVTVDRVAKVTEAARLARKAVLFQSGRCGGRIARAMEQVSELSGIEFGSLKMLWERPNELKSVDGFVLDTLRQINGFLEALANNVRQFLSETATDLEKRGDPCARIVRKAADLAGVEKVSP